jgi:ligand-binding sensor domain-containing protein
VRIILNSCVFCFLFLFFWKPFVLMALHPDRTITQYNVKVWNMESGLPDNSAIAVLQTQDGYLWIGTQNGLVRFDGVNFELFNRAKVPQLKSNVISALYQDQNNTLWIGTQSGGLTRYKEGEFTTYSITQHPELKKIRAINEDRWGNLWIASLTQGLTCLRSDKFTNYTTEQKLPHNEVRFIYKDGNGDLWTATWTGIIKVLKTGPFPVFTPEKVLSHKNTACLFLEDREELWIATFDKGLFRWKLKDGKVISSGFKERIFLPSITYLYKDRRENLRIGTDGHGLKRMSNGKLSTLSVGDGLTDGFVYSIYEDNEGSLWVGTLDHGLYQLRDSKFITYTTREGLPHDYINCIYESRDGDLRIGTNGGLSRLSKGTLTTVLTSGNGLLDNSVLCLFEDPAGYDRDWVDMGNLRSTTYTHLPPGYYTFNVNAVNSDGVRNDKEVSFSFYLRPYFYQTAWFYFLAVFIILLAIFLLYRFRVRQLKTKCFAMLRTEKARFILEESARI